MRRKKHIHIDLTTGSIKHHLIQLSYPMAFGILAIMTFNLIDTFFISFLGVNALAAIGFIFPLVMIMTGLLIGLAVGNNVLVSRAFGMHDHKKAARYATDALLLSLLIIFAITALGFVFMDQIFAFMGVNEEVLPYVKAYMIPWLIGLVFMGLPVLSEKSLAAMGDTKTPAKIMMLSALINVVLDPLLIFGIAFFPKMGIAGASWATVFSRVVSTVLILIVLYRRNMFSFGGKHFFKEMMISWKRIIKISLPTSFNTVMIQVIILIFNKIMANYGVLIIAGFGVAVKIEAFAAILLLALGESMPSFIGQNFGAKRHDRINSALNYNAVFSIFWSFFCFLFYNVFGDSIAGIFTQDVTVTDFAVMYLIFTSISYSGVELMYASHSLFNSIDKSHYSVLFTIIQTTAIITSFYIGSQLFGIVGGVTGFVIGRIAMGYIEFVVAKFLLSRDADTGRFFFLKPHFIKLFLLRKFK